LPIPTVGPYCNRKEQEPRLIPRHSTAADLERAKAVVEAVAPSAKADFACMLMASALAGIRGLTMRHIRVGALFWPDKFKDDPYLSMRGGWGCEGYSVHDGRLWLAEPTVDDDGSFAGHTWLEPERETVIDLMHDNEESGRELYGADFKVIARYIPRPPLERGVKTFWKFQMGAAIRLGAKTAKQKQAA
jgi:hypothetical protein